MKQYMGQVMAECDCTHPACDQRGYCMADRIVELEAKLAADRAEVIALIRKDAENGDISHGAAQWVIDTILAELSSNMKGQDDE